MQSLLPLSAIYINERAPRRVSNPSHSGAFRWAGRWAGSVQALSEYFQPLVLNRSLPQDKRAAFRQMII
jgi:hypothetical protein